MPSPTGNNFQVRSVSTKIRRCWKWLQISQSQACLSEGLGSCRWVWLMCETKAGSAQDLTEIPLPQGLRHSATVCLSRRVSETSSGVSLQCPGSPRAPQKLWQNHGLAYPLARTHVRRRTTKVAKLKSLLQAEQCINIDYCGRADTLPLNTAC